MREAPLRCRPASGVCRPESGWHPAVSVTGGAGGGSGRMRSARPMNRRSTPGTLAPAMRATGGFFRERTRGFRGRGRRRGGSASCCSIWVLISRTCSQLSGVSMPSPRIQPSRVSMRVVPGWPSATRAAGTSPSRVMSRYGLSGGREPADGQIVEADHAVLVEVDVFQTQRRGRLAERFVMEVGFGNPAQHVGEARGFEGFGGFPAVFQGGSRQQFVGEEAQARAPRPPQRPSRSAGVRRPPSPGHPRGRHPAGGPAPGGVRPPTRGAKRKPAPQAMSG